MNITYIIVTIVIVWICFFLGAAIGYRKGRRDTCKHGEKPSFRTEESLPSYGKKMEDTSTEVVDFDDAE